MLFNSFTFAIFLPIVFIIYWYLLRNNFKLQNLFLIIVGYIFYGWWDWRFLSLLFFSSIVDFSVGLLLNTKKDKYRLMFLSISLFSNLGLLSFFKYYNFFISSFIVLGAKLGISLHESSLKIILPVGISFYTFQTLSYVIDVYRRKLEPTKDIISFFAFVSFFPQLVAGPIERATHLLPHFLKPRSFDYIKAKDGLRQILWGLIKKVVIADTLAQNVEHIFNSPNYASTPGITLFVGAIFFAFQIYCDFSGYSDIAIGTAKLFGFDLMRNFAFPFFSRNIGEFWQRWHISLSTWFRDYVFIPLGGNKVSKPKQIRNIFATFLLSGFWHGANWTFIIWGGLHALFYLPLLLFKNNKKFTEIVAKNKRLPTFKELIQILFTFSLFAFSMIFFRSDNLYRSLNYIKHIFTNIRLNSTILFYWIQTNSILFIILLVVIEWIQRDKIHILQIENLPKPIRWSIYATSIAIFIYLGNFDSNQQFIYFQF